MPEVRFFDCALIEPLEARIAPAILFTYTDVDGDLVSVKISKGNTGDATFTTASAGTLGGFQLQTIDLNGNHHFDGANITVTAKPQTIGGIKHGDGLANVGFIDASGGGGINLGLVSVNGDLRKINAGNGAGLAINQLKLGSMGELGASTIVGTIESSTITGNVKSISIRGNIVGGSFGTSGNVQNFTLGGSLIATDAETNGQVTIGGTAGAILIKGDIRGANGGDTGIFHVVGNATSIAINGSIVGGPDSDSGQLVTDNNVKSLRIGSVIGGSGVDAGRANIGGGVTSLVINGSIVGSDEDGSGVVDINDPAGKVVIRGDVRGGAGKNSGVISSNGFAGLNLAGSILGGDGQGSGTADFGQSAVGNVVIAGSIVGGVGDTSGHLTMGSENATTATVIIRGDVRGGGGPNSGQVEANHDGVTSLTIQGSVIGAGGTMSGSVLMDKSMKTLHIGDDLRAGSANAAGFIKVTGDPKLISVGGSIFGGAVAEAGEVVVDGKLGEFHVGGSIVGLASRSAQFAFLGDNSAPGTDHTAVGKITVGHDVRFATILAGWKDRPPTFANEAIDADAQIGSVQVGGDWIASNLIAGTVAGADTKFGTVDDVKITDGSDDPAAASQIGSVVITGQIAGTVGGSDAFGFVSQTIVSFKVGGAQLGLIAGTSNDVQALGVTGDVTLREVS